MKLIFKVALAILTLNLLGTQGCKSEPPSPICQVSEQISVTKSIVTGYDGVDLLIVVDNSGSMAEEQEILATAIHTLINTITDNPLPASEWPFANISDIRVAVVSSDLGLQFGPDHITDPSSTETTVPSCTDQDLAGDDGLFISDYSKSVVAIQSGVLKCTSTGKQCPADWNCSGGVCVSPDGENPYVINCPDLQALTVPWLEKNQNQPAYDFAGQVACLTQLGTQGCGVEQQLEAAIRGLSRDDNQRSFLVDTHLLAVLVISDEEDCSIEDKNLFQTDEWTSGAGADGYINVACNYDIASSQESTEFLFESSRYWQELVALKNDVSHSVIFAAIVGVPPDPVCEGIGNGITDCLDDNSMVLTVQQIDTDGVSYNHFAPACTREENGVTVTEARPGRRYVQIAQDFISNGYVSSICNKDWSPAMLDIARMITRNISLGMNCYHTPLEWNLFQPDDQGYDANAPDLGQTPCTLVVSYDGISVEQKDSTHCPPSFNIPEDQVIWEENVDNSGNTTYKLLCPLPQLSAPLDCMAAQAMYNENGSGQGIVGWYYCENQGENFDQACSDGLDNDLNGLTDCKDEKCADCPSCNTETGEMGPTCENSCKWNVVLTKAARKEALGREIEVRCPNQSCAENTAQSCNDGKDNDGNGLWDCDDGIDDETNLADPSCCPLEVTTLGNGAKKCAVDFQLLAYVCWNTEWSGQITRYPQACYAAAELLGCELP